MFNFEEHVTLPPQDPASTATKLCLPENNSKKEVLVKICLDQNEGVAAVDGRYRTFYNMYFVNKLWVSEAANAASLQKVFNSFVIAEYSSMGGIYLFSPDHYSSSTTDWLKENLNHYYFLFPIVTIKKGTFKFNGVYLPVRSTILMRSGFAFHQHRLTGKALCVAGVWKTCVDGGLPHSFKSSEHCISKTILKEQESLITEWVYGELDRLSYAMAG